MIRYRNRASQTSRVSAALALLLAACAAPTPTPLPPPPLPAACAAPGPVFIAYFNLADGYCLLHPAHFRVRNLNSRILSLSGPPLDYNPDPVGASLSILIEDAAGGRTLAQVVDEYLLQLGRGAPAVRASAVLAGEAAEIVEGAPGRTGAREAFVIHNDAVYHLSAYPLDDAFPQSRADVETVWQAVSLSFTFLPPEFSQALAACPPGTDGAAPYLSFDLGLCFRYPSLMSVQVNTASGELTLTGPARDWEAESIAVNLAIRVSAANDQSPQSAADDFLAQLTPEQRPGVTRSPVTLGGAPGIQLDGAPGPARTRAAFVVLDDRLYTFSLSPHDDPALTAFAAEAEAVWQTVAGSFVFVGRP
jgi:hypothetical protein